jgi:hypothetical protein
MGVQGKSIVFISIVQAFSRRNISRIPALVITIFFWLSDLLFSFSSFYDCDGASRTFWCIISMLSEVVAQARNEGMFSARYVWRLVLMSRRGLCCCDLNGRVSGATFSTILCNRSLIPALGLA